MVTLVEYSYQEGLPEGCIPDFEEDIFFHPQHLKLQAGSGWHSFSLVHSMQNTILAAVHFHVESILAESPYRAPFGSVKFSNEIEREALEEFLRYSERQLSHLGVKKIILKNPPVEYDPVKGHQLNSVLTRCGYGIEKEEVSAIIPIKQHSFDFLIHPSERKRLRKCEEAAFKAQILPLAELEDVYYFLKSCREKKGYSLSMPLNDLRRTVETFPDNFILMAVKDLKRWAAANISIRVNSNVLYNFYHDHDDAYDQYSPVVLLNQQLYQYCQQQDIRFLDLGTSQTDSGVNESLLQFKLRLGAQPSSKLTFAKNLS